MKTFLKPLTTEEETFYLRKCRQGDKAARDVLIERNLRLVAHIVKKYQGVDEDLDDLISIGTIGLIKAVSTYDMTKGSRLATDAARCIDNELLLMLRSRKKFSREVSLYEPRYGQRRKRDSSSGYCGRKRTGYHRPVHPKRTDSEVTCFFKGSSFTIGI